jgi:hypothetical protein
MLRVVALAVLLVVLLGLAAEPFFMAELEGVVDLRYFLSFITVDMSCAVLFKSFLAVLSGDAVMLEVLPPPPNMPPAALTVSLGEG